MCVLCRKQIFNEAVTHCFMGLQHVMEDEEDLTKANHVMPRPPNISKVDEIGCF